jgi:hypothetical protein
MFTTLNEQNWSCDACGEKIEECTRCPMCSSYRVFPIADPPAPQLAEAA